MRTAHDVKGPAVLYHVATAARSSPLAAAKVENTTVVASGQDGPIVVAAYDPVSLNSWTVLGRSYGNKDGTGPFATFQAPDSNGVMWDSVALNGGFILTAAGKMSSCLDILGYTEGKRFNVSVVGAANGYPACLASDPPNLVHLGSSYGRWAELWLQEYPPRATMPKGVKRCVRINGGYVPVYD